MHVTKRSARYQLQKLDVETKGYKKTKDSRDAIPEKQSTGYGILTDQSCIHKEVKSRINSGNACYNSVQSLLSSRLVCKNSKYKIYETIILPVVLYGCETLVSHTKGQAQIEGSREQSAENNILNLAGGSGGRLEKEKENTMGGACSTHGRDENCIQYFR
jgi:hypothetical protein